MKKIDKTEIPELVKGAKIAAAGTNDSFWNRVQKELDSIEKGKVKPSPRSEKGRL